MTLKKGKKTTVAHKPPLQLPSRKKIGLFKKPSFLRKKTPSHPLASVSSLKIIRPQLLLIAACLTLYYAMVHFYLFFAWGFFIYYALKLLIAYAVLSAARHSLLPPLCALLLGTAVLLFTNNLYLNTLMDGDTAWQWIVLGLVGCCITLCRALRSHYYLKKGKKHA